MVKTPPQSLPLSLPPLENGDRLNRYEFERRYNAMPKVKKAELIEGVVDRNFMMPHSFRFSSLAYLMQFILLIALTGCEAFPVDIDIDSSLPFYEMLSFGEQANYKSLIKRSLDKDRVSLVKLSKFDCGGGSGCYGHGEVLTKIAYHMGEKNFIELVSNMTRQEKINLRFLIRAGLEYGDFKNKQKGLSIEQAFPELNRVLQKN